MRIHWVEKGKKRRLAAGMTLLAGAALLAAGLMLGVHPLANVLLALALTAFAALAFCARVEIRGGWGALIALLAGAGASVMILHLPLFHWTGMTIKAYGRGVCLAAALMGAAFALTANIRWFSAFWFTFCWAFGLLDAAVLEFSGNAITVNDISAIGTAANVAANYRFQVLPLMVSQLVLYVSAMALVLRMREDRPRLKRLRVRLLALAFALAMAVYPAYSLKVKKPTTWNLKGVRLNSAFMELLLEAKTMRIRPPAGYSEEALARLAEEYPARAATVSDEKRPHVIAIMIEAFSDLSVLGDFETDVDYMPFTRQLMDQSISGTALVSTFGGGTARSEWEFLTGNTMGFMPAGSMPYRQFMGDDENSIVKVFENAGYHTIGMHPFKSNGWGRNKVYPALGFDDIYFIDDLEWDEYVRHFASDRAFVHQVIRLFENRDYDEPMFFFGVTMQNHSDYDDPDYPATVHLRGFDQAYPAVEQYLSLVRDTDDAIRELIEYFSNVDEPVQIVFFGDHEPNTKGSFRTAVGVKDQKQRYLVPFVMWDNYEHRAEHVELTSLNFLPAMLIDLTGVQKPVWYSFLTALNEKIQAMNHMGYYAGGDFHSYSGKGDDDAKALLKQYRMLVYANMFDDDADRALFNGTAAGADGE